MAKIGFIGVGMMGHGMAGSLLRGGHHLTVIAHRNRAPVDDLVSKGAREALSRTELVKGQDGVFLCVTGTPQVEAIMAEIEPALVAGQTIVDMGTSIPESTLAIAARLAKRGIGFVDAPVGGGPQHAEAGELVSMVGASDADYAKVKPWLELTAKNVVRMGQVGAGARAKLLNNLVAVGQTALVVEAYKMARDQGIDWQSLYDVNMGGAARSGSLERTIPPAILGNYRGNLFSVANCAKDLGYYVEAARAQGADTTIASALRDYFAKASQELGGETMLSELLKPTT